jgi:glyoxylase I family protein
MYFIPIMLFSSVNHVAIIVSDLDVARDFYTNKLGFTLLHAIERKERQSTILYLDAGNCIIELFSFPNPPPRPSHPEACGLRHLAFTVEDLNAAIKELHKNGITTEPVRVDARTGKRHTFFPDPDRLPIEICEA